MLEVKLNNITKVNGLLATAIESYVEGSISSNKLESIERSCRTLVKGLEVGQLEQRILELEERL